MKKIKKKILTDDQNRPVGVLIKYQDWLRLEQELNLTPDHSASLSKLAGTIKLTRDPLMFQKDIRTGSREVADDTDGDTNDDNRRALVGSQTTQKELENEMMRLPLSKRAELAEKLILSLDAPSEEENLALWVLEAKKRLESMRAGRAKLDRLISDNLAE